MFGLFRLLPTSGDNFMSLSPLEIYLLKRMLMYSTLISSAVFLSYSMKKAYIFLSVNSPYSIPSFQSLPEDIVSKVADVLEEVIIFRHFSINRLLACLVDKHKRLCSVITLFLLLLLFLSILDFLQGWGIYYPSGSHRRHILHHQ